MRASTTNVLGFALFLGLLACTSAQRDARMQGGARVTPAREIVSGSGQVRGGGTRMDVQIGRPLVQSSTRNDTHTARPAGVLTP